MNGKQALAAGACSFIAVLFLHNPISGWQYETEHSRFGNLKRTCTAYERKQLEAMFRSNKTNSGAPVWSEAQIEMNVASCTEPVIDYLPLDQWRSNEPHVEWFGRLVNVASLLVMITMILVVLHWLHRPAKNSKSST